MVFLSGEAECSALFLPGIFWEKQQQLLVAEVTNVPTCKRGFYTIPPYKHWTYYIFSWFCHTGGAYIQSASLLPTENADLANKNNFYI